MCREKRYISNNNCYMEGNLICSYSLIHRNNIFGGIYCVIDTVESLESRSYYYASFINAWSNARLHIKVISVLDFTMEEKGRISENKQKTFDTLSLWKKILWPFLISNVSGIIFYFPLSVSKIVFFFSNENNFRFYKSKHEEEPDDIMAESRVKVSVDLYR